MTDNDLTPEEQREQDALQRILERFVIYCQKQIGENFQHQPEAQFNRNLFPETVYDMAMAAQIYRKIFGASVHDAVNLRMRGIREFMSTNLIPTQQQQQQQAAQAIPSAVPLIQQPQQTPQKPVQPPPGPDDEMDLLSALTTYGTSGAVGAPSQPQAQQESTQTEHGLNLTKPLTEQEINAIKLGMQEKPQS